VVTEPAILKLHFPLGALPAKGYRCPVCADEVLLGAEAAAVERLARRLGLFGIEGEQVRTLLRTGGSIAVTLDPALVRDVLRGRPGSAVRVGRQGDRIVIRPA
jgi:hypothetical protein